MLVRIVLTLVVIALAIVYLRKRHQRQQQQRAGSAGLPATTPPSPALEQFLSQARQHGSPRNPDPAVADKVRAVLLTVALVVLAAGGIYSYLYWQDQQRLVTVLLHRDSTQPPVIYRVAKRDLSENSFVTDDGTRVTVSANERMEVVGL